MPQQLTLYLPSMLIAILSAFAAALLFGFSGKGIHRFSKLSFLLPTALFAFFSVQIPAIQIQGAILDSYTWVPTLGVSLGFKLD
jgi:NADH:ubiquinone oxidoreductase subunit 5 (subunit L)/multisubunit Na+/H+ antiporter MnhA subunit